MTKAQFRVLVLLTVISGLVGGALSDWLYRGLPARAAAPQVIEEQEVRAVDAAPSVAAQQGEEIGNELDIHRLMPADEFEACGLSRLQTAELNQLNAWLTRYTEQVMRLSTRTGEIGDLDNLEGASVVAQDGQFLGVISRNRFDANSIANEFGTYGSQFNNTSILNRFSQYGSEFSNLSPFSRFATKPPIIVVKGDAVAWLTVSPTLSPRVNPYLLLGWLEHR